MRERNNKGRFIKKGSEKAEKKTKKVLKWQKD